MANQLKHTPGPWAANKDTAFVRTAEDDQYAVAAVYGYRGDVHDDEVALANARLIAAAPELLGFAQLVLRGIEAGHVKATPFMDFSSPDAESVPMRSIGDLAREVVAKATGAA